MKNMRFKVGDRVRINSLDWYNRHTNGTEVNCKHYPFSCHMKKYCGQIMTISDVRGHSYDMIEDDGANAWTDEMIEGLVEEEDLNLKFKDGDRVFNTATRKWVNIIEFDLETGLYIVRYDDGLQGRSLESELTFEDDEEE